MTDRSPTSPSAKVELQPVSYKRFDVDNPNLPETLFKLAATIMMKDEEPYIHTTISAAAPFVDCFVFLDTGSTDGTIAKVKAECKKYKKPCFVMEIPWIQFGPSRNYLMEYVESIAEFALLMDASDEVRGGEKLKSIIDTWPANHEAMIVRLQWNVHAHNYPRLVKTSYKLRYTGVRHNALVGGGGRKGSVVESGFVLFQDRSKAKSSKDKYAADAIALFEEFKKDPKNTRTVFYLAQSYKDSGQPTKAYKFYKKRATMGGWREEIYMSHYYCGGLAKGVLKSGNKTALDHFYDAFNTIATPLTAIEIFRLLRDENRHHESHVWIRAACSLPNPKLSLQDDVWTMGPKRWMLFADSCSRMNFGNECVKAYVRAHLEYTRGDFVKRTRPDNPPPDNCNAKTFEFCWNQWGELHPEWFESIPDKWLSEKTAIERKLRSQKI